MPVLTTLLAAGARRYNGAEMLRCAGRMFEFHRAEFAAYADAATAMRALYEVLCVAAPSQRCMHDGMSPIMATTSTWQAQHAELWALTVPSKGVCKTAQGEVIRISGRAGDPREHNNGQRNWDKAMMRAFCAIVASMHPLAPAELAECVALSQRSRASIGKHGVARLAELAVRWVALNPIPVALMPTQPRKQR